MSRTSRYSPRRMPRSSNCSTVRVCRYVYCLRSASVSLSRCATSLARLGGASCARAPGSHSSDVRMRPMAKSFGGFRAALLAGWMVLGVAGLVFARAKGIPFAAALPVIAAFLAEYPFYLVAGFPAVRRRLAGLCVVSPGRASSTLPAVLTGSLLLPYLLCCCGAIRFDALALVRLASLALALSLWYVILPAAMLFDAAFLALIGWVTLGHYFDGIYPRFFGQHLDILARFNGHFAYLFDMTTQSSTTGDEPGVGKGVRSNTVDGKIEPTKGSGTFR